ncbi:MAG: alginate lyase family protein [Candidatus Hydrogenedentes bacterium]|nr:alginate lyase family protein [Candidatus Hydrogenedentota bacterium]
MAPGLQRVLLYAHTIRHLTPLQLYWRLRYRLRSGHARQYSAPRPLPPVDEAAQARLRDLARRWSAAAPPDPDRVAAFLSGRFTFLNKTVQSSRPRWSGLDVSKLWLYHLHGFAYARDIALLQPDPSGPEAERVRGWMIDWAERNARPETPAWDAYPLSERLLNWSLVVSVYGWDDVLIRERMHAQLDCLRRCLEYDLRGNHLLKNACALAAAGTLLGSPHRRTGVALLEREAAAQFLPDGGHAERSPMYHAQALADLAVLSAALDPAPGWLVRAGGGAIDFLRGLLHGDGRCAQFNDGAADEGLPALDVIALAETCFPPPPRREGTRAWPESGIYRIDPGGGSGLLIAKAGKAMLDSQPGHAHSDLLSFEFSVGAQRVLVNSGTHGYAESEFRNYCRGATAHNTLQIGGRDQHEHWSVFRIARRVHAVVEAWDPAAHRLRASYRCLHGPRHSREFAWDPRGWWRIEDTVHTREEMYVAAFLHLHPDCAVTRESGAPLPPACSAWRIAWNGGAIVVVIAGAEAINLVSGMRAPDQGWCFPQFGVAIPAPVLIARRRVSGAGRLACAIVPEEGSVLEAARALAGDSGGASE